MPGYDPFRDNGQGQLRPHFQSIAMILPYVLPEKNDDGGVSMLEGGCGECRSEVEGMWPVLDPWEPDLKSRSRNVKDATQSNNNVVSSPLARLTVSTMTMRLLGNGTDLGGSHMPPSKLSITSRSASGMTSSSINCLTQIEMPLINDNRL